MDYFDQLAITGELNDVGAAKRVNIPRSHRAGLEIESKGRFLQKNFWQTSMTFSQNKIKKFTELADDWDTFVQHEILHKNTDLALSPRILAGAELGREFLQSPDNQSLTFVLSQKYVGKQYLDNTQNEARKLAPYYYADLRARYFLKFKNKKTMALTASINNIFGKNFVSNGWTYHFFSKNYDPRSDDFYARKEGENEYNLTGFFPQAANYWLISLSMSF
jgi:iron complex outermembrane receptor protein